jgi:hypothetical protein
MTGKLILMLVLMIPKPIGVSANITMELFPWKKGTAFPKKQKGALNSKLFQDRVTHMRNKRKPRQVRQTVHDFGELGDRFEFVGCTTKKSQ